VGADDRRPHLIGRAANFFSRASLFSPAQHPQPEVARAQVEVATLMDFSISSLPLVNALLNGLATILLLCGYTAIRRRQIRIHRAFMLAAFVTSVLFLISYVTYHAHVGSRPFTGHGPIRTVYFTILISHVVLAAVIPALAGITLWQAFRNRFDRHVRIARWTLPLWLYVSVTGILVYWMLYQMS
jgi:uncharacterized membrane protein YozB (DUF420 family)